METPREIRTIVGKVWLIFNKVGTSCGKAFAFVLNIVAPQKEAVRKLEKMDSVDIKRIVREAKINETSINYKNLQAIFAYKDPLTKNIVWEIKYRKNLALAEKTGELMLEEMKKCIKGLIQRRELACRKNFYGTNFSGKIILAPIPSSGRRRRERGFNQCEIICEAIMKCAGANNISSAREIFIYEPNLIAKTKNTKHQANLSRENRLKNISGSFAIPHPEKVAGKIIFIVDDVITTGKTMSEVRQILLEAHAREVFGFAIAH